MELNKLSPEVYELLINRLTNEYEAFYLYRAAANWCADKGYELAQKYFEGESTDELAHAKKIEDYLTGWNMIPNLPVIKPSVLVFANLADIINKGYNKEYDLYCLYEETSCVMMESGNVGVFNFLQEFVGIQTSSVAEYATFINKLEGIDVNDSFKMRMMEEVLFE